MLPQPPRGPPQKCCGPRRVHKKRPNSYSGVRKTYIYELGPTRVVTQNGCGPKEATNSGHRTNTTQLRCAKALDKTALSFEENKGSQTPGA